MLSASEASLRLAMKSTPQTHMVTLGFALDLPWPLLCSQTLDLSLLSHSWNLPHYPPPPESSPCERSHFGFRPRGCGQLDPRPPTLCSPRLVPSPAQPTSRALNLTLPGRTTDTRIFSHQRIFNKMTNFCKI